MKAPQQVIDVGPDDELTTVVNGLRRADQRRVVLVVADEARVLRHPLGLKLLQREAEAADKEVALLTANRSIRTLARELGLAVGTPPGGVQHRPVVRARSVAEPSPASRAPAGNRASKGTAAAAASRPADGGLLRRGSVFTSTAYVVWRLARRLLFFRAAEPFRGARPFRPPGGTASRRLLPASPIATADARPVRRILPGAGPLAAGAALLAPLLAAIWVVVEARPIATISVTPVASWFSYEVVVSVDPRARSIDAAAGIVPGRLIELEEADSARVPTTGRRAVPDQKAQGDVLFTNKGDRPATVPKGSVVQAAAVKFVTQADVTVPGTVFAGPQQRFGMQKVGITAAVGGSAGNVKAQQIASIDGLLARSLEVVNVEPTRGGSDRPVTFVTADDRRRLQESLHKTLTERITAKMQRQRNERETLLIWPDRAEYRNPAVREAHFDKNAEEESSTLALRMRLGYGATAFRGEHVNQLVEQLTRLKLAESRPQFQILPGTIHIQPPQVVGIEGGLVQLLIKAEAQVAPRIDAGQFRHDLKRRTLTEATAYLAALPGLTSQTIFVQPEGRQRLPRFGFRIAVVVGKPLLTVAQ